MPLRHKSPLIQHGNLRYKFVELSIVTDDTIERTVNEWVSRGWMLDGIRFAMSDASRRPAMAFISFVREVEGLSPGGGVPADPYGSGGSGPH